MYPLLQTIIKEPSLKKTSEHKHKLIQMNVTKILNSQLKKTPSKLEISAKSM